MADYSYIGVGNTYLRDRSSSLGLIPGGNVSKVDFKVNEETKESPDYTQGGGGTFNEVRRIKSVEVSITFTELNAANIARGAYGEVTTVASSAVTGEAVTVYPGALAKFASMPLSSVVPTITTPTTTARANATLYALNAYVVPATANGYYYKATTGGTSAASIPTYPTTIGQTVTDGTVVWTCAGKSAPVAGTDYEVRGLGLFIINSLAGEVWTVNYTKAAVDVIQALVNSGKEYEFVFDGLNEARSGKKTAVEAFRVKLGAFDNLSWIGDDYASVTLTGKILKDTTKTGVGISQYFKAQLEA